MTKLALVIANKNYSSWSMRPWVLMKQAGIEFEEIQLKFDDAVRVVGIERYSPAGKVPVLLVDGQAVWDTLAIAETLAEQFPEKQLWGTDPRARARARSVCAEMHSGFGALRSACPMNIEASLPAVGALALRDQPAVRTDLARLVAMWSELLTQHGGPMLFGPFSIADAYFAPVVMRIRTYALPVPAPVAAYIERLCALPGVKAWIDDAVAEKDFLDFEEPYRLGRN